MEVHDKHGLAMFSPVVQFELELVPDMLARGRSLE